VTSVTLRRPDDWHLHLRDGAHMAAVLPFTAARFARALVMPNLKPPMTTTRALGEYRDRILAALPAGARFEPLMTLYLTDRTPPDEIRRAKESGFVVGAKLYPAGATTHSDAGVTSIENTWPALEAMAELGLVLQVHGEVTDPTVDVFDREHAFIDRVLSLIVERVPGLKIVFEHITTAAAAQFVRGTRAGVAATLTPQHVLMNRNAIFEGGLRPHHFCLPVLKRERDREALLAAATSDDPRFFLGTDSAPHARHAKEASCGCAGIFSAHAAIELYAEAFEQAGRLDRLEAFASERGADFYGLPRNTDRIVLRREPWTVPERYPYGGDELVPLRGGASVGWRMVPE
jgi:dihydroorotase